MEYYRLESRVTPFAGTTVPISPAGKVLVENAITAFFVQLGFLPSVPVYTWTNGTGHNRILTGVVPAGLLTRNTPLVDILQDLTGDAVSLSYGAVAKGWSQLELLSPPATNTPWWTVAGTNVGGHMDYIDGTNKWYIADSAMYVELGEVGQPYISSPKFIPYAFSFVSQANVLPGLLNVDLAPSAAPTLSDFEPESINSAPVAADLVRAASLSGLPLSETIPQGPLSIDCSSGTLNRGGTLGSPSSCAPPSPRRSGSGLSRLKAFLLPTE